MNRDTVIGIVGSLVLIAAMVGVFFYEQQRAAALLGDNDPVTFTNATAAGPTGSGTTALGQGTSQDLTISTANLTSVRFTLTWTATNGADTLRLTVQPPAGVEEGAISEPEDDGSITVSVAVPNPDPTNGAQTLGVGTWRITVDFTAASGLPPAGLQPDQSVDWNLATQLTTRVAAAS